jgi:hypothetical protein
MSLRSFFLLSAFFLHSTLIQAEEPVPLVSGLWEITTRPDFKGIPAASTQKLDRICLSEFDIREGKIALRVAATCKVTGGKWEKTKLTLDIFCPDAPPDVKIPAVLDAGGTNFTSYIELNPQIRYNHSGKWLKAQCQ